METAFASLTRKATRGSHSVNDASGPAWQELAAVHAAGSRGKSVAEYMTRQQSQAAFAWTLGPSRDSPGKHNRLPDTAMRKTDASFTEWLPLVAACFGSRIVK